MTRWLELRCTRTLTLLSTPQHDLMIGSKYGMLGSVDCNTGDPLVGWDTDQFAMDIKKCVSLVAIFRMPRFCANVILLYIAKY